MPPSPARFQRHFLPWDRPWLPQVAAWLAREWDGDGPLDLSGLLAIVPTRQSGRRLREALAGHAAARGSAVFAPRTLTPDTLLAEGAGGPEVATRLEAILAWARVLRAVDPAAVPAIFPQAPPRRDFSWAWRLGESLFALQTALTEGGLGLGDVVPRAGGALVETERWRELAGLERRQAGELAALGRREPHAARRAYAREAGPPAGVTRIVLLGVPDPLPLAVQLLERWALSVAVDVVVFAPEAEAAAFDAAGRPVSETWTQRVLELDDFEGRVHLCPDPARAAERAAGLAAHYRPQPDGLVAYGIADAEVLPLLGNELSRAGLPNHHPEGRRRRGERLYALLAALADFARAPTFDALAALARCPDFLAGLSARGGTGFSAVAFLAELDDLHSRYLPADLAGLRRAAALAARKDRAPGALARALPVFEELQGALAAEAFAEGAVAALQVLFAHRQFDLARGEEARMANAAAAWRETVRACAAATASFGELDRGDWWTVALQIFGEMRRAEDKLPGALELQGWLELMWEDAPHLVVVGLNDGLVPEAIVGDPFLPESLRAALGLKTNPARFARDAYLLQALAASRNSSGGRLDLLFAKTSAAGDPLRPSRLLLACAPADLPARVAFLFRPAEAAQPDLPWTRAWRLTVPAAGESAPVAVPERVSVTALRTWLECPFRFYLRHILKMEAVDPAKSELDALDFGTLCHAALEAMAREPGLGDSTEEGDLRDFLLGEFDRAVRARYGPDLTLPLVVQFESARQRLAKAAAVQARERAAGWRIDRVETPFTLDLGGLAVRGKIDRIDRHEATGAWRVIDYKTSDTAKPPVKSHLRALRDGDAGLPPWRTASLGGRDHVWIDLQLPLYLRALAGQLPADALLSCGYFNLPKAAGETDLAFWEDLDAGLLKSAWACADGVAAAIRAGEFWPPAELPAKGDEFAPLFHHGVEESVAWPLARAAQVSAGPGETGEGPDS